MKRFLLGVPIIVVGNWAGYLIKDYSVWGWVSAILFGVITYVMLDVAYYLGQKSLFPEKE